MTATNLTMYLVINLMAKQEIIEFLSVSFTTKKVALFSVFLQRLTKYLHHFSRLLLQQNGTRLPYYIFLS